MTARNLLDEVSLFVNMYFCPPGVPPCKLLKKGLRAQTKGVFKVPGQSAIHIQDLKEVYFVTNLGYEDLRETGT